MMEEPILNGPRAYVRVKMDGTIDTIPWDNCRPSTEFLDDVGKSIAADIVECVPLFNGENGRHSVVMLIDENGYMKGDDHDRAARVNPIASLIYNTFYNCGKFHYILGDVVFATEVGEGCNRWTAPFTLDQALAIDRTLHLTATEDAKKMKIPEAVEFPKPEIKTFDTSEEFMEFMKNRNNH